MFPAVQVFGPALAGIIFSNRATPGPNKENKPIADRSILFLDYQNVYKSAREAFHRPTSPHWDGQIDPVGLGELIVERTPFERRLHGVRIYRGIQDSARDPRGYGAARRQMAAWSRSGIVETITRTLQYSAHWPSVKPVEKGIDVSLALDFALMAYRGEYDVGILMSTDTDLVPALEAVAQLGSARVEVAAWSSPGRSRRRLTIKRRKLWCHWLDDSEYRRVRDKRDYTRQ